MVPQQKLKLRTFFILVGILLLVTTLASPVAAFGFIDELLGNDDNNNSNNNQNSNPAWIPPENINELTDEEYIKLWGGFSLHTQGSQEAEYITEQLAPRLNSGAEAILFNVITGNPSIGGPYTPTHTWNTETIEKYDQFEGPGNEDIDVEDHHEMSQNGGFKHSNHEDNHVILDWTYFDMTSITPSVEYSDGSGSQQDDITRYVHPTPNVNIKTNWEHTKARDRHGPASPSSTSDTKTEYSIHDTTVHVELQVFKNGYTNQIASKEFKMDSTAKSVKFDLYPLTGQKLAQPGDEIYVKAISYVTVTEKAEQYGAYGYEGTHTYGCGSKGNPRSCTARHTYYAWDSSPQDTWYPEWKHKTQTEKFEFGAGEIYAPDIRADFSTIDESEGDTYVLELHTDDQKVLAIAPREDGQLTYPVNMYSTAKPRYKNSLGRVTPVTLNAIKTGSQTDTFGNIDFRVVQEWGPTQTRQLPSDVNINTNPNVQTVRNFNKLRVVGENPYNTPFDGTNIDATPVVPEAKQWIDINTTFDSTDVVPTNIDLTRLDYNRSSQEVTLQATVTSPVTGSSIVASDGSVNTGASNDVEVRLFNPTTDQEVYLNTPQNGTVTWTMEAEPRDTIKASVDVDPDSFDAGEGFLSSTDYVSIPLENLNYQDTTMSIFIVIIRIFIVFIPTLAVLSLITKALTGEWTPFNLKENHF